MLDPVTISLVLHETAKKAVETLVEKLGGKAGEELLSKLKGDPARNAFKKSLGLAIQRYATGERLSLAKRLLAKDSVLTQPPVAEELGQILRFDRAPDAVRIGQWWERTFADLLPNRDYTQEAKLFLSHLRQALTETDVFRPVFEAKSLDAIAASSAASSQVLASIENQLATLNELIDSRFGELTRMFAKARPDIRDQIRDFAGYIEDRTGNFVGRYSVFNEIDQFIKDETSGYILLQGDPGIGKSSIAAQLVKTKGYVHHFNIRAEGINTPDVFLKNVCAQLISVYRLEHASLPSDATHDSGFLKKLLKEVSDKRPTDEKVVIVIDALDEVNHLGLKPGTNQLFLPMILDNGVYVVLTLRKETLKPRIECKFRELLLRHDSDANQADIKAYVQQWTSVPSIQTYISAHSITSDAFIQQMSEKSQGNFMYLRYVLPEIAAGAYKDFEPKSIPSGLKNYYEDHWQRMRSRDEEVWFKYKLPILMVLTSTRVPVSIDLIAKFSRVAETPRIRAVLQEWGQFLHEEVVEDRGKLQKRYRVYHESFHEFIAAKEEVADERVNLKKTREGMAEMLWQEFVDTE